MSFAKTGLFPGDQVAIGIRLDVRPIDHLPDKGHLLNVK